MPARKRTTSSRITAKEKKAREAFGDVFAASVVKRLRKLPPAPTKITLYEAWMKGYIGNFGSFQTAMLNAYTLASNSNKERLEKAYPEWFRKKSSFE